MIIIITRQTIKYKLITDDNNVTRILNYVVYAFPILYTPVIKLYRVRRADVNNRGTYHLSYEYRTERQRLFL